MGGEVKRDRYGRYLLPGETGRDESYMRATSFAKVWADTFHLSKWQMRKTAVGLASRPDLLAAVAAADPGDSKTLNGIVEQAKEAAGANSGATIGSAIHKFTENLDLGVPCDVPAAWVADVEAYRVALEAAGLQVLPEYVEAVVANDTLRVAGTLDRIVRTADGRLLIADLKTGQDVPRYMGEIACQLALYAGAEYVYDYATGTATSMPAVDQTEGLVFWLPAGSGHCEVLSVDLTAGFAMIPVIRSVLDYRKRKDIHSTYAVPAAGVALADATGSLTVGGEPPVDDGVAGRLAWIREAAGYLRDNGYLEELARRWPSGVPTLKQAGIGGVGYTPSLLDSVYTVIRQVAAVNSISFDLDLTAYPGDMSVHVGAGDPRVAALRERIEALPADMVGVLLERCGGAGIPKLTGGKATVGDLLTVEMLVAAYETLAGDYRKSAALHLSVFPERMQKAVLEAVGVEGPGLVSEAVRDRLAVLADGYILKLYGDDLVPTSEAVAALIERLGSKTAVTAAGREAAETVGLVKPTNSGQVAANVVLFAATYMGNH